MTFVGLEPLERREPLPAPRADRRLVLIVMPVNVVDERLESHLRWTVLPRAAAISDQRRGTLCSIDGPKNRRAGCSTRAYASNPRVLHQAIRFPRCLSQRQRELEADTCPL